jgi:hypothetical protein
VWKVFRYPEKLTPWFGFVVALGAGVAVGRALDEEPHRKPAAVTLLTAAALCVGCALLAAYTPVWAWLLGAAQVPADTHAPLTNWLVLNAGGTAAATALLGLGLWRLRAPLRGPLLVAGQGALLCWFGLTLPQTVDLPVVHQPVGFVQTLLDRGLGKLGGPRVHGGSSNYAVPPNAGLDPQELVALAGFLQLQPDLGVFHGLEATNYYLPAGSSRLVRTIREGNRDGGWVRDFVPLYGAEYIVMDGSARAPLVRTGAFEVVDQNPDWSLVLLRALRSRPRAFVAFPRCVESASAGVALLQSPGFRTDLEAVIQCPPGQTLPAHGTRGGGRQRGAAPLSTRARRGRGRRRRRKPARPQRRVLRGLERRRRRRTCRDPAHQHRRPRRSAPGRRARRDLHLPSERAAPGVRGVCAHPAGVDHTQPAIQSATIKQVTFYGTCHRRSSSRPRM